MDSICDIHLHLFVLPTLLVREQEGHPSCKKYCCSNFYPKFIFWKLEPAIPRI